MKTLIEWLDGERGRRVRLAESLKINPGAISQWTQVPADRCIDVEAITGISRYELRPDIYGTETPAPAETASAA